MAIIKGARNIDAAKTFYDWALSVEAQTMALRVNAFQVMSHIGAAKSEKAPDMPPRHGRNQTDRR
jgi:iron(III) transport system substrate-binding protein